jgi:putative flippase GtrA
MTVLDKDIVRFGIVGTVGFLVDSGVLSALVYAGGWNPLYARVVSMSIAVLCTWFLHRYWTFSTGRLRSPLPQTFIHAVVQLTGLSVNYVIFSALLFTGDFWRELPVLAVAIGSLTAMVLTYLLSKTIAFGEPGEIARRKKRFAQI